MGECHHPRRYNAVFCWEIFGPGVYVDFCCEHKSFALVILSVNVCSQIYIWGYDAVLQDEADRSASVYCCCFTVLRCFSGALISQLSETVSTSQVLLDAAA